MNRNEVRGLREFLLVTLKLLADGYMEKCDYVEENISGSGIASALVEKHGDVYRNVLNQDSVRAIDEYYHENWSGIADGQENKYLCSDNGLQIVIAVALNEIF